ncbi:MAG: hypothetical protein R2940_03865 [Syntrophotaleaceae bacterium]
MTFAVWAALAASVAMLAFAKAKAPQERVIFSDLATHVMIASSIWNDFDLDYTLQDLARFRSDFPAESGPRGLFLKKQASGELVLAKPYLYGAAASVFYGVFGVNGFIVLNAVCLFLIGSISALTLSGILDERWALVVSLGFVLPGPFTAWVSIPHPDLFIAALLAVSVILLLRETGSFGMSLLAALMFAAAVHEKPSFLVLLPFILLAVPARRGLRERAIILGVGVIALMAFSAPNLVGDGSLFAYQGARFNVRGAPFPLEKGWALPDTVGFSGHVFDPLSVGRSLLANLALLPGKFFDFLFGRQTGILVYFPVALALLAMRLFSGRGAGFWLIAGFFTYLGINWLVFPINGYGGSGSYGPRYMMQALPLVPLAFYGHRRPVQFISGLAGKCLFSGAIILALALHGRVPFAGEDMVRLHTRWFLEPPLRVFPIETWLLPYTASPYPPPITEKSDSSDDILFHLAQLESGSGFGLFRKAGVPRKILFQSGAVRPVQDLELISSSDATVLVKHGKTVLWQGSLLGWQPTRLSLEALPADGEAYDLLSGQPWRWASIELHATEKDTGLPAQPGRQTLRFAREYARFEHYDRLIPTAELPQAGVLLHAGWSRMEPWGVWSADKNADLLLYFGEDAKTYELTLRMHGYCPPEDPIRKLRITANGRFLARMDLEASNGPCNHPFRFDTRPGEKFLQIGFEIDNPVSPAELGHSADARHLGVGLSGLSIRRIEEPMR